jgi:hypothetical protein
VAFSETWDTTEPPTSSQLASPRSSICSFRKQGYFSQTGKLLKENSTFRTEPYNRPLVDNPDCDGSRINLFFIDTFVSLANPSLQLRLTTSLFSNLDSALKTNSQYLSIVQCRVLVFICSHILPRSCLAQIPLVLLLLAQITTRTNTVPWLGPVQSPCSFPVVQ